MRYMWGSVGKGCICVTCGIVYGGGVYVLHVGGIYRDVYVLNTKLSHTSALTGQASLGPGITLITSSFFYK